MKKNLLILGGAFLLNLFILNNANAMGLLYTNTDYPITATGVTSPSDLHTLKQGQSSALNVLGLVEMGDAGINKAAKDGDIKKINFIDINVKTVLFFFGRITTTVYGE